MKIGEVIQKLVLAWILRSNCHFPNDVDYKPIKLLNLYTILRTFVGEKKNEVTITRDKN